MALRERWRKSSYSSNLNGCVEVWRKSSYSASGNCAEAALADGVVLVRDSKLGEASPLLEISPAAWSAFLSQVKA